MARKKPITEPHWEHGYRVHGYWLGQIRLGRVSRPPGKSAPDYGWFVDGTKEEGRCKTLREAKSIVERKARQ